MADDEDLELQLALAMSLREANPARLSSRSLRRSLQRRSLQRPQSIVRTQSGAEHDLLVAARYESGSRRRKSALEEDSETLSPPDRAPGNPDGIPGRVASLKRQKNEPPPEPQIIAPRRSLARAVVDRLSRLRALAKPSSARDRLSNEFSEAPLDGTNSSDGGEAGSGGAGAARDSAGAATESRIPEYVAMARSGALPSIISGVQALRRLLSRERSPPIAAVIRTGVVPDLVALLDTHDDPRALFETLWALTNVASGTSEETRVVVSHGAVPRFAALLRHADEDVAEQAAWALGNIAGDCAELRDVVLAEPTALEDVCEMTMAHHRLTMRRNATWAMSNLCRAEPHPHWPRIAPVLRALAAIFASHENQDGEVLTDASWAFSYIMDIDAGREAAVAHPGFVQLAVRTLATALGPTRNGLVRGIGNLAAGTDAETQAVVDAGGVAVLAAFLPRAATPNVLRDALWALSNVAAGTHEQVQAVLDAGNLHAVLGLAVGEVQALRREATHVLMNLATEGSEAQRQAMADAGAIRHAITCAETSADDAGVQKMCLTAVAALVKESRDRLLLAAGFGLGDMLDRCAALHRDEDDWSALRRALDAL